MDAGGSDLMAFAVGTPGEWDWRHVFARSAEEAWKEWSWDQGVEPDEVGEFDPDYVTRIPAWDGRSEIKPADWLRAGLGHHCERCDCETCLDDGAAIVAEAVVCDDCLTFGDRLSCDTERARDDLADMIADDGEQAARQWLEANGYWPLQGDLWARAVRAAA